MLFNFIQRIPDLRFSWWWTIPLTVSVLLIPGTPADAACRTSLASPLDASVAVSPVLVGGYWNDFVDFWTNSIRRQNSIVLLVLGVGAVALFIITRGNKVK
jgi:hypothetical protein